MTVYDVLDHERPEAIGVDAIRRRLERLDTVIAAAERELAALDRERTERILSINGYIEEYNRHARKLNFLAERGEP